MDYNGGKAIEAYKKYNEEYTLTYGAGERLLVTVEGEHMGLDAVKEAAGKLDLKTN